MHLALSASYLGTDLGGRYRLERLIGEGASSWVFAAADLRLEREVAVKLLKRRAEPEHTAQRLRFVQEGRVLAKLAHPHVVAVHDAGETLDGDGYLVMELSQAGTLEAELSRRSALDLEETLPLIVPLLGALACAHDRGIIHRDLKPANVALVRHEGGKTRAKLLDFGIARCCGQGTTLGGLVGTPAYMAPEQARAEALGPSADVWALGVILFRCLSGRLPFEASSASAMLLKLIQERAASIASVLPNFPPHVAVALDRALEPDPTHRYPDTRTFARVLGVACRQDGVRIDLDPDPIGLPDFGVWLQRADIETTRRKNSRAEPGRPDAPRPATARQLAKAAPAWPPGGTAFWTVAVLAGLAAVLWSALGQPVPTRGQPSPREGAPRGVPALLPEHVVNAPQVGNSVLFAPVQPAPDPPATPAPRRTNKPARAIPRVVQIADGGSASPTVPAKNVGVEQARPGLITNWEW